MNIKNARDLSKIIAICRKKGVQTLKIAPNGVFEFTLLATAPGVERANRRSKKDGSQPAEPKPAPQLTEEDVLFYSSSPIPNPDIAGGN